MTVLTFYYWWITAIIIILIGLSIMGKLNSKVPLVIAIVLAIIVAIMGKSFRSSIEENSTETAMNSQSAYEYII